MTAVILVCLLLLVLLGEPLFVIIGGVTALCLFAIGEISSLSSYTMMVEEIRELADKEVLLAIPFFVVSGAVMTGGSIAQRLIDFARALFGFLPGGLAVSSVFACVFFAAISGSSPVTVIAIGGIMLPALLSEGYEERFATGLVTSAGSLGILIPPSIPMIVYAIMDPTGLQPKGGGAGASLDAGVKDLFLAGVGPGILIGSIFAIWSVVNGRRVPRSVFSLAELGQRFREGFWALMLPVIILGGIYSGLFTPTEAAAVSVVYALGVELLIHRQLRLAQLPDILVESAVLMGSLLIIMALAIGFNKFLVLGQVTEQIVSLISTWQLSPVGFLLAVNVLLLLVGCLMDILSAILILVPLLSPLAVELGIHPIHLGVIFIVNLEIGYLTPPLGLNLFVSMSLFQRGLGFVVRSVLPFTLLMLGALMAITYVPTIALGPVNALYGQEIWVPFPEGPVEISSQPGGEGGPAEGRGEQAPAVKTLEEMMREVEAEAEEPVRVKSLEEMMREVEAEAEAKAARVEGTSDAGRSGTSDAGRSPSAADASGAGSGDTAVDSGLGER